MSMDGLFQQLNKRRSVPDSKRHEEGNPFQSTKAPSARKCILLHDWWLVKADPDPHGKQLGIGGFTFKDNQGLRCFTSESISKRHDAVTLETVDGITVMVQGYINRSPTLENGFSEEVCSHFLTGFPYYWEEYTSLSVSKEPDSSSASNEASPSDAYKTPVQEARADFAGSRGSVCEEPDNSSASKEASPSDTYKTPVQEAHDIAGDSVCEEPDNSSAAKEVSPSDAYKTPVEEGRGDLVGGSVCGELGISFAAKGVSVSPSDAYKTLVQEARTGFAGGPLTRSRSRVLATRRCREDECNLQRNLLK